MEIYNFAMLRDVQRVIDKGSVKKPCTISREAFPSESLC